MKLQLVSDLHIESNPIAPFETRGDVLVIAGDTHVEPAGLAQWLQRQQPAVPAIIVLGNHEFDHKRFDEVLPAFRAAVADFPNVHLLERDRIDIGGVTFLGANLWTDMRGGLDAPAVARVLKWFDMRGVTVDDLMAVHRHDARVAARRVAARGRARGGRDTYRAVVPQPASALRGLAPQRLFRERHGPVRRGAAPAALAARSHA